jgi:hypothetical protein
VAAAHDAKIPAGRSAGLLAPDALAASGMSVAPGSVEASAGLQIGLEFIDILQADVESQLPVRRDTIWPRCDHALALSKTFCRSHNMIAKNPPGGGATSRRVKGRTQKTAVTP